MLRRIVLCTIALSILGQVSSRALAAEVRLSDLIAVLGKVSSASGPVENAVVLALNLSTFSVSQAHTSADGTFRIVSLPAGVYRIIAVKQGFVPDIRTLIPTQTLHQVALRLRPETRANQAADELWEIRRNIPPDVLRELGFGTEQKAEQRDPRISGAMQSVAGVSGQADPSFSQTALDLKGRMGGGWTVDFAGSLRTVTGSEDGPLGDEKLAESRGVVMEVHSSPGQSYRVASSKNIWRFDDSSTSGDSGNLESHRLGWKSSVGGIELRYLEQDNLFARAFGSKIVEVMADTMIYEGRRSDFGVSVTLGQENTTRHGWVTTASVPVRRAAVMAGGNFEVVPSLRIGYGARTRYNELTADITPHTSAEWKFAKNTALVVSGLYKMKDGEALTEDLPAVVFINDEGSFSPRYRYSVGLVSAKREKGPRVSAHITVTSIDSLVRLLFDDRFEQYGDGFYLDSGDLQRDLTVTVQRELGRNFLVDVSTSAGSTEADNQVERKTYFTGSFQSLYRPSGTVLDLAYRYIEQPRARGLDAENERLNFRVAQSLHLPINLRLLLGFDLARVENAPVVVDVLDKDGLQKRVVGGVSFAF